MASAEALRWAQTSQAAPYLAKYGINNGYLQQAAKPSFLGGSSAGLGKAIGGGIRSVPGIIGALLKGIVQPAGQWAKSTAEGARYIPGAVTALAAEQAGDQGVLKFLPESIREGLRGETLSKGQVEFAKKLYGANPFEKGGAWQFQQNYKPITEKLGGYSQEQYRDITGNEGRAAMEGLKGGAGALSYIPATKALGMFGSGSAATLSMTKEKGLTSNLAKEMALSGVLSAGIGVGLQQGGKLMRKLTYGVDPQSNIKVGDIVDGKPVTTDELDILKAYGKGSAGPQNKFRRFNQEAEIIGNRLSKEGAKATKSGLSRMYELEALGVDPEQLTFTRGDIEAKLSKDAVEEVQSGFLKKFYGEGVKGAKGLPEDFFSVKQYHPRVKLLLGANERMATQKLGGADPVAKKAFVFWDEANKIPTENGKMLAEDVKDAVDRSVAVPKIIESLDSQIDTAATKSGARIDPLDVIDKFDEKLSYLPTSERNNPQTTAYINDVLDYSKKYVDSSDGKVSLEGWRQAMQDMGKAVGGTKKIIGATENTAAKLQVYDAGREAMRDTLSDTSPEVSTLMGKMKDIIDISPYIHGSVGKSRTVPFMLGRWLPFLVPVEVGGPISKVSTAITNIKVPIGTQLAGTQSSGLAKALTPIAETAASEVPFQAAKNTAGSAFRNQVGKLSNITTGAAPWAIGRGIGAGLPNMPIPQTPQQQQTPQVQGQVPFNELQSLQDVMSQGYQQPATAGLTGAMGATGNQGSQGGQQNTQNIQMLLGLMQGGMDPAQALAITKYMFPEAAGPTAASQKNVGTANQGLSNVAEMRRLLGGGASLLGAKLPNVFQGDKTQEYNFVARDAMDIITRLRTGAALNEEEQRFYMQYIPTWSDKPETVEYKLSRLEEMYRNIGQNGVLSNAPIQETTNPYLQQQ